MDTVGDVTYGAANDMAPRMMLHAWNLQFHTNDKEKVGGTIMKKLNHFFV
jgi:23S rRNA-/tRNA-specific pseudouridylate synthase